MSGYTFIIEECSKADALVKLDQFSSEQNATKEIYETLKALINALPRPYVSLHWVADDSDSGFMSVSFYSTKDHREEPTEAERVLTAEEKLLPQEQKDQIVRQRLQFKV